MKKITGFLCLATSGLFLPSTSHAGMAQLINTFSNELENRSARAALQTYQDLIANAGCFDAMRAPAIVSASGNTTPTASCTGQTYQLFKNVRAIVHTANELTNDGPTQFSLGLDKRGLGFALRWDAAEEYSAQGSLAGDYLRGQISNLGSRLTALRFGAQGFHLNAMGLYNDGSSIVQNDEVIQGGGAGDEREEYSPWGGFINYSGAKGNKAPTSLEDAFSFRGNQFNGGFDYRFNPRWVAGSLVSYIDQRVDFDSSKSIVSGHVDATGFSIFPFVMYQREHFYASGSVGYQELSFDSLRAIRYPSLNPDIPSPNTQTLASTTAKNLSAFLSAGYNLSYKKISLEPFVNINATQVKIDSFVERDANKAAFDLVVDAQNIHSATATVGASLRYTFTPSFAVITPYANYELVKQRQDDPHAIAARYLYAPSETNAFSIPTDITDDAYNINTLGVSAVLMGGHQKAVGGDVAGGLQAFAQYKQIKNLANYEISMVELGLRYEF
ncbi:autotransporter outer membrane beta-barrel domain-containing protein [Cellvibrio sp.]|uniref:autotransporter outer membrane beta-barrel domain-containing protein n=1 Tax=Cellvibrio sp. TaxID=1965322 RepID=UPI0039647564